ncbi:MAG: hypothetical protein KC777_11035 [Cyanobacteria bacterium HKST-UBA02]|nr:hypothetical protein [Cyanobacteria bacterium HKST-UBA02]
MDSEKKKKRIAALVISLLVTVGVAALFVPNLGWFVLSIFFSERHKTSVPFLVELSQNNLPVITYSSDALQEDGTTPFSIFGFYEVLPSDSSHRAVVWKIDRLDDSKEGQNRLSFSYGDCPPGYKVTVPAEPLLIGHYYAVNVSDIVKKSGEGRFELIPIALFRLGGKLGVYKDPEK